MSWLYSQALVEEYLVESCLDGAQSAPLNGSHIQQAYLSQDKMTAFSRVSRFGMTYKPLTESRGEELLTLYLAGFRAKTSVQPEKAQELKEPDRECGRTWQGLLAKYDPVTHLWKTAQCSLLEDLEQSLQTWPKWGLMQDGVCWEQPTLVQTIKGTESGLKPNGITTFHTPNCTGLDGGSNSRKALKKRMETWPTPLSSDWKPRGPNSKQKGLAEKVKIWPTPTSHNAKETNAPSESNRNTPTLASQAGGKLNPIFVEWLMGWPLGWTDLKPLGMDKFHCAPQQHGES